MRRSSQYTRAVFCFIVFVFASEVTVGQNYGTRNFSVLTFSGYTFQDKIEFSNGYGQLDDGLQWGAGLEASLRKGKAVAFVYQRIDTRAGLYGSAASESARIAFNYFMASGTQYQPVGSGMVNVFASLDLGSAVIDAKDLPDLNFSRFAWGLRLGASAGDRLQGRIYGQLYSVVHGSRPGYYFGASGASGVSVSDYGSLYQFHVGAGISYRLNE